MVHPVSLEHGTVALAGDWHGNAAHAQQMIYRAANEGAGALIQLGDFGIWPGAKGERFLDAVSLAAQTSGLPVYFIDGNHEDFDQLLALPVDPVTGLRPVRPGVWHLPRGSRWVWNGLQFCALGGATSLDRPNRIEGLSWWRQEAISLEEASQVVSGGLTDILLTHDCPEGVAIPGIDKLSSLRRWPEQELRTAWAHREQLAAIVSELRPTHLFHGHFHNHYVSDSELHGMGFTRVEGLADDTAGLEGSLIFIDLQELKEASAALR